MQKKHTIVHVITSLKMGGAESLLVEFLSHERAYDYNHVVVYFHDGPNLLRLQEQNVQCYHIKGMVCMYDPVFFVRLYAVIKSLRPDCIHSWLWSANIASRLVSKLLKIPLLNSFHSNVDQDGTFRNYLDYYTQHIPHSMVAVSYGVAQSLTDRNALRNPGHFKIIKNGLNTQKMSKYGPKIMRHDLGLLDEHYLLGTVGRWVACKNYSFLIDLFAALYKNNNRVRLLMLGEGEQKDLLQKKAADLGLSNKIFFIEGKVALEYYSLMDCFIQTSFKEGISIALLEAMSFGLPCMVVQSMAHHDVIKHDHNGVIIPTHSLPLSCDALENLILHRSYAKKLGERGYQTIQKEYDIRTMIANYYQEYNQLINTVYAQKK